jgi:hypothetical protein
MCSELARSAHIVTQLRKERILTNFLPVHLFKKERTRVRQGSSCLSCRTAFLSRRNDFWYLYKKGQPVIVLLTQYIVGQNDTALSKNAYENFTEIQAPQHVTSSKKKVGMS